jgi:hypothetical protein
VLREGCIEREGDVATNTFVDITILTNDICTFYIYILLISNINMCTKYILKKMCTNNIYLR